MAVGRITKWALIVSGVVLLTTACGTDATTEESAAGAQVTDADEQTSDTPNPDDSGADGATDPPEAVTGTTGEGGNLTAVDGPQSLEDLEPRVEEYRATPTDLYVTTPVQEQAEPSKELAVLVCGVPVCSEFADAMEEAATELDWAVSRIDLGVNPEEFAAAYERALEVEPDMVIGSGLPSDFFSSQLEALGEASIPVLQWSANIELGTPGVSWVMADEPMYRDNSIRLSEWFVVDGEMESKVALFNVEQYGMATIMTQGIRDYLPTICPDCSVDYTVVGVGDIGTNMPSIVTGYLQENPDTQYVFCSFGDLCTGVGQALTDAGLEAKIVTGDPGQTNFQNIANGLEYATLPLPTGPTGWAVVDAAQRILTCGGTEIDAGSCPGLAETRAPFPQQIVTEIDDPASDLIGAVPDFKDQYRSLWNLD